MVNSIVHSTGTRAGGQIRLTSGGTAAVTYSSIKTGFTGIGNLTPADANTPQFNTAAVVGGQRRVLRASPCLDNGNPAGIPGFTYWTRLDPDGEARRRGFGIAARASKADIGADEFVSRLNFPKKDRIVRNKRITFSEVDEASDVAFLGQLPNGNAKVAVINDEVVEWDQDANGIFDKLTEPRKNVVSFYEISASDGSLVSSSEYSLRRTASEIETTTYDPGEQEVRDPEGIAYDPVNRILLVTTSQTKVNRYRDCETTEFDPLVDPPSNDYEPRRNSMVKIQLDTSLVPTGKTFVDNNDGPWTATAADRRDMDAFAAGLTTVSPVGFDSTKGLIETIKAQLSSNTALGASVKNTGVLIAINTSPKFGEPVNGVTYQPGAGLPYNNTNGLGGASATGGWVLHLPANAASADFPYWALDTLPAAGQEITSYKTSVGGSATSLVSNTAYYFKAWAFDGSRNYSRGIEASATTSNVNPVKINEFKANGSPDWAEFFNPSGQTISIGGYVIMDDATRTDTIPAGVTIAARSYYTIDPTPRGLGDGSDNIRLFLPSPLTPVEQYEQYTRNQAASNTEGRVWDGGPRGKQFDYSQRDASNFLTPRFESEGGLFRTGSVHPISKTSSNNIQSQSAAKYFQATQNHLTQTGIYLHYVNLGEEPATWRYSPKQQDFHPISVEGLALKSQSEIVVGLRSPLSNRTTGNAYAFVFSNASNQLLPTGGWTTAAGGLQSVKQLNLNGQGIRSIQWCSGLNGGAGAYLIIGGSANGGPLKNETSRQVFSLYRWDSITATPVRVVADLAPFAVRPEGVNIISLNGTLRVVFVEDRFKAQGYDTQNGVHWSLSELNLQ